MSTPNTPVPGPVPPLSLEMIERMRRQVALDRSQSAYWTVGDRAAQLDAVSAWLDSLADWFAATHPVSAMEPPQASCDCGVVSCTGTTNPPVVEQRAPRQLPPGYEGRHAAVGPSMVPVQRLVGEWHG